MSKLRNANKVGLAVLLAISTIISAFNIMVFISKPGLHYLLAYFGAIATFVIAIILLIIAASSKKHRYLAIAPTSVTLFTFIGIYIIDNTYSVSIIAMVLTFIALSINVFGIVLLWSWN